MDAQRAPTDTAWRALLAHLRPCRHRLLLGGLLGLITGAAGLVLPLAAARLLDDLAAGRPLTTALLWTGLMVGVTAVTGPFGQYVLRSAAESVVFTARKRLIGRLLRLRMSTFDRLEPGDLLARVTADTTLLRQVAADSLVGSVTGALIALATVAMMAVLDPVLLAVTLAVLSAAALVVRLAMGRVNQASEAVQESVGRLGARLERSLGALRTVKAAAAEDREEAAALAAAEDSLQAGVRAAKWLGLVGTTGELALQLAFFTVLGVGGARVAAGAIGVGTLIAFLMYVFSLVAPVQQLVAAVSQYHVGAAAILRIEEATQLPSEPRQGGRESGRSGRLGRAGDEPRAGGLVRAGDPGGSGEEAWSGDMGWLGDGGGRSGDLAGSGDLDPSGVGGRSGDLVGSGDKAWSGDRGRSDDLVRSGGMVWSGDAVRAGDPVRPAGTPVSGPSAGRPARPASVVFEDVRFRYAPDLPPVHHGIGFRVPPRGMTAFVGPSGAGKTTVFALLERFYEPTSGRILLDGTDLSDWHLPDLRTAIGYVEQDAPVLAGTLHENLLLGAPATATADLPGVLHTTRLETLLGRLPQGLDTQVGHRGTRLSGGERQRVAIARALLRRPRLLLLDEATSQLDAVNEAALRDTLTAVARTTTVLVVAHRLSTVTAADRIVVMDAGTVRAIGTHSELLGDDALYRELATTQFLDETRKDTEDAHPDRR
ncbi:ABC transporter ATP-binding protein/permease [Streptomyces bambusae]|uniref:ABC transporter ATP-binding protein n=1 Tax=Streptomyces bambusae TaxID=1550616 RepID=UPI001CFC7383|nr:ABC transporter ATP-binding protein [Streptomyces bambusae]MCB5168320.1 ABC transporter ATP-binding protein/permease [Streptomyces bambusae]